MQDIDLLTTLDRQISAVEESFESVKDALLSGDYEPDSLGRRLAYIRELKVELGEIHETRRQLADRLHTDPDEITQRMRA